MKLATNINLPSDPSQLAQRVTELFRAVNSQVNGVSEGTVYAFHNAYTAAPTTGTYAQGDFIKNSAPSGGTPVIGWICTVAGTPGTWVAVQVGGGGGSLSDGDYGDITVSGSVSVLTVDNDVVTYAKMQNVSAASKLVGRGDSGSGDPQEITLGTNLAMSGATLNVGSGALGSAAYQNTSAFAANAHDHDAGDITSGTMDPAILGTGTADSTTYLRGDSTWQTISSGGLTSPQVLARTLGA